MRLLALALVLVAGCGGPAKYAAEKYVSVGPKEEQYVPMLGPEKTAKVSVTATTGGVPVELYLVTANNPEEAERIVRKQDTKNFIASRINKVDPAMEGTLPAGATYVIAVVNDSQDKTALVTIRIKERE